MLQGLRPVEGVWRRGGAAAGTAVSTYFVSGNPIGFIGSRFFGTNQGGTIYQAGAPVPVTQQGAPGGGAVPIQ
ncbi:MAG: hypothetical protein CL471_11030 [Acidobacteria bacterium]|nr:hypothetical protein [Acidobacteriota bacterium]